jgi:membrane-bound serine protease (ClpP class)
MQGNLWPFGLLLVSIVLLVLETLIPSAGMLGILSALALLCAIIVAFLNFGMLGGMLFLVGCVALAPIVFSLLVHYWPKTPIGRRILIRPPKADDVLPRHQQSLKALIGKIGTSISPMLPGGTIRIEGQRIDAVSEGIPIDPGTVVEVIAVQGNQLVVRTVSDPNKRLVSTRNEPVDILSQPVDSIVSDPFQDPLS